MARKAAAGTGNIRKKTVKRNGKEYVYWEARYTAGYDPGTGKQIQRSITGKTQKEVAQKLKEATHEIDEGTYQEPSRLTVGEWLDIWQRDYMRGVKPATEKVYATAIRIHLKPALGAVKLQALHPHTIQRCINEMDDKYASGTVHRVYMVLHLALERAFQLNYIFGVNSLQSMWVSDIVTGQWKIFCVWKWQKSAKTLRETRKNIRKSAQEKTLYHI